MAKGYTIRFYDAGGDYLVAEMWVEGGKGNAKQKAKGKSKELRDAGRFVSRVSIARDDR